MRVALARLPQRSPNVPLIPGTASLAHLRQNVAAADVTLSARDVAELDGIAAAAIAHERAGSLQRRSPRRPMRSPGRLRAIAERALMGTTIGTVACACSGTSCAWISHATSGATCENNYDGDTMPSGWELVAEIGVCCPSCVAIRELRAHAPLPPLRWSRERGLLTDALTL